MRPFRREQSALHQPVLTREIQDVLELKPGLIVVDATVGAGGHSRKILNSIRPGGSLIGIDRDPMMLSLATAALGAPTDDVFLTHASYVALPEILAARRLPGVDRVLADLGFSSDQLADESRGFSFAADGPLDLRFDTSIGEPAAALLDRLPAEELLHILREFGEEPFADRIAAAIVHRQRTVPIRTARELSETVERAVPHRQAGHRHAATRVFQALRIAVNDELQQVAELVNVVLPQVVAAGGRAAVLTFHSLEDRLVKRAFARKAEWQPVTPKPITASSIERRQNPRSRSAKLRVAVRV
jgi:16S rRNA (cytosine1402-N4)-methyltransferase